MSKKLVPILLLTLITLVFWVFFTVFRITTSTTIPTPTQEIMRPLNPTLDTNVLEDLNNLTK